MLLPSPLRRRCRYFLARQKVTKERTEGTDECRVWATAPSGLPPPLMFIGRKSCSRLPGWSLLHNRTVKGHLNKELPIRFKKHGSRHPKQSRERSESPLVASADAKLLRNDAKPSGNRHRQLGRSQQPSQPYNKKAGDKQYPTCLLLRGEINYSCTGASSASTGASSPIASSSKENSSSAA